MDALFNALDEKGYQVEVTLPEPRTDSLGHRYKGGISQTRAQVHGEFVSFELVEQRRQIKVKSTFSFREFEYSYEFTGRIGLHILSAPFSVRRSRWRDGKKQRVEDLLGQFVAGLEDVAHALGQQRLSHERRRKEREERLLRQEQERQAREATARQRRDLEERLDKFHRARLIREFVANAQSTYVDDARDEWLTWALRQADELEDRSQSELRLEL